MSGSRHRERFKSQLIFLNLWSTSALSGVVDCDCKFHGLIQSTLGVLSGMNCVTSPSSNLYPFGVNRTLNRNGLPLVMQDR